MIKAVFALALAVLLLATFSFAQTSKGTIAGTVTDQTGAVVRGATVTAKDTLGAEVHTEVTGDNGQYRMEAVQPSIYDITTTAPNFATVVLEKVEVKPSVVTPVNPSLQLASTKETITVEANAATVNTESAELSKSVSQVDIRELPVGTLNPIELELTQPGAVSVSQRDSFTNGVGFSVDGLRPRANNFLIDGFDNNDNGIQGQAIQPQNVNAVKEVVVQTNSYSAEFGRGGASVTNVIYQNGTNRWHGGLWELYAGSTFNAITAEQHAAGLTSVPRVVQNIFGFSVGGPILKNKLFVFGSSQWDRNYGTQQGATLTLPTANGIASLQAIAAGGNTQAPIILQSLGNLVAPQNSSVSMLAGGGRPGCPAPCNVEVSTFNRIAPMQNPSYEYVVRADYVASDKDTVTGRYLATFNTLTPDLFANPTALPGTDTEQSGPSRNLGLYWTHVISPAKVNELRFTVQQLNFGFNPLASTLANPFANAPDIEISGLTAASGSGLADFGGIITGFPQNRNHLVYQYQDAFSITAGRHSFKFGADILHLGITDDVPFNSRGALTYFSGGDCSAEGIGTCTGIANFLDDFSGPNGNANKQFGVSQLSYAQSQLAFYFQDTFKFRPNLTVNYGLRYEYQGTPFNSLPFPTVNELTALHDPLTLRVPEQPMRKNFGPRLGVAYTPHFWRGLFGEDKTVFRAGAGIFYDVLFANITDNTASSTPNVTGGTITGASGPGSRGNPNFSTVIPGITPQLSQFDAVTTAASNIMNPRTYQWNANIERQLPGQFLLTVAYVGTRGTHLFNNRELNPGIFDPNTGTTTRLNPDRGSIFVRSNHGDSVYHGLQVDAARRFSHGLLLRGAWTYSRSIDNTSEIFVTSGGSTRFQDQLDPSGRADRGPSAFDRKHRAVFTWVYDLPKPPSGEGFTKVLSLIARDWQISGTAAFETGAPETIHTGGFDINGDLSGFNDRPFFGSASVPINFANCFQPTATCDSGVGFSLDGVTFTDFNSSFGFDPVTGNFTAKASDFRYYFILGKNGNVGRNSFYNPGRQDWTMAVSKRIKMPMAHLEGQQIELRMEAFNPWNHANLGGGANGVASVSGDINSPNFLDTSVTKWGGRSVRFWVKYNF